MVETVNVFTTQEAAKAIGMSDSNLRNLIRWGKAHPLRKFGDSWLFTQEEIDRLRNRKSAKQAEKTGAKV